MRSPEEKHSTQDQTHALAVLLVLECYPRIHFALSYTRSLLFTRMKEYLVNLDKFERLHRRALAALGLADCSQVDMLGIRYKPVKFRPGKIRD